MIKVLGAIFILSATTWAGLEGSKHLGNRPKQLRLFRDSLQALEAEIMYAHIPLGEAAQKIAVQLPKPIADHYYTFAKKLEEPEATVKSAWKASMQEIWSATSLQKGEFEILAQFGENLGQHDKYTQQKQILLTLSHLAREEEHALERQKSYEKLVKSFGVLSGLLVIILLF